MKLSQAFTRLAFIVLIVSNAAAQTSSQKCPVITVSCPDMVVSGTPIHFVARIDGPFPPGKPEFTWSLSAGKILEGQGTSTITVNTDDLAMLPIKATLQVMSIGNCHSTSTGTTNVATNCPISAVKFDEYGYLSFEDEKARLDGFATLLKNMPGTQGHIIGYVGLGNTSEEIEVRLSRSRDYLVQNHGLELGRVVTQNGGKREELRVELFVVPTGAAPPKPEPSDPPEKAEKESPER